MSEKIPTYGRHSDWEASQANVVIFKWLQEILCKILSNFSNISSNFLKIFSKFSKISQNFQQFSIFFKIFYKFL